MKIKKPSLKGIGFTLFLLYCFFSDLFDAILGSGFSVAIYILSIACLFWGSKGQIKISRNNVIVIILVLAAFMFNNQGMNAGSFMPLFKFVVFLLMAFFVKGSPECYKGMFKTFFRMGLIHVFATIILFIFPTLYSGISRLWPTVAGGTKHGRLGYRAALCDHYSGNGIMIAITYITIFAFILAFSKQDMKKRRLLMALFGLALFAMILTTKRAHLLFGLAAIIFVYFFCNPEKMKSRTFKLIIVLAVLAVFLIIFADDIPVIGDLLKRFEDMDEDSNLLSRYKLWGLALEMFRRSPVIGNGWMSFRIEYSKLLYTGREGSSQYMNAHNIYLQLLAEVGVIGLILFLVIMAYLVFTVLKLLWAYNKNQFVTKLPMEQLYFAAIFLVFFMMYGMTGNCLYDRTEPFFFIVCGLIMGYREQYRLHQKQRRAEGDVGRALPEKI